MGTLRGPAQLADLQEALCVPTHNFTCGVDELDMLLWQRSSNLSDFFFVAIFLFLFIVAQLHACVVCIALPDGLAVVPTWGFYFVFVFVLCCLAVLILFDGNS